MCKKSWGVKKRLDAPKDFPLSQQSVIVVKTGVDGIKMTSGFMFEPVKTFGYILEFTTDEKVFNAQHDCSKCSNFDCPRRSNIKTADLKCCRVMSINRILKRVTVQSVLI